MRILIFGVLFGFLLSRAGATHHEAIARMFLLQDLHLMGVIGVAILVAAIGLRVLRRLDARTVAGEPALVTAKPVKPGLLVGGLVFGAGWALTGACPGTTLAQVGEGQWLGLFTVAGILAGTALYARIGAGVERVLARRRGGSDDPRWPVRRVA